MAGEDERAVGLERRMATLEERVRVLEMRLSDRAERSTPAGMPGAGARRVLAAPPVTPSEPRRPTVPSSRPAPETIPDAPTVGLPPGFDRPAPARARSYGDLEQLITGRFLAWAGGLAILFGALFFLVQAFRNNWIGETGRVGIGIAAGGALFLAGAWFFERREALLGHVLVATGLGTLALAFVAATRLYGLMAPQLGLLCSLAVGVATAIIAVRAGSQVVAAYGLVTALAAPPLLGAAPALSTVLFVGAALVGVTVIALYRSWGWLPALAFLLSAPQVVGWLHTGPARGLALAVLAGYWALNAVAAGGEEFRTRASVLRPTSATLLLANAAFLVAGSFIVLDRPTDNAGRGLLLLCAAVAHVLLGAYFLRDEHDRHPFGLLAVGTGIAALTLAVPVWLGGPVVPIAWAAEAAALAWVYSVRQHGYSGAAAVVLGTLAGLHLVLVEYPYPSLLDGAAERAPFKNGAWGTLCFFLLAIGLAAYWVRSRHVRAVLASAGFALVLYALPFETSGLGLLAGWGGVFLLAAALDRTSRPVRALRLRTAGRSSALTLDLRAITMLAAGLLAVHALAVDLPPWRLDTPPRLPFRAHETRATALLVLTALSGAALAYGVRARQLRLLAAVAAAAWLMPFELAPAGVVVAWSALAAALSVLSAKGRSHGVGYAAGAGVLAILALALAIGRVAPPDRLAVSASSIVDHPLLASGASLALAALVGLFALGGRLGRTDPRARWLFALSAALAVYALSVGVVDEFQRRVGGGVPLADLRKQAQVALSILWALLGGVAFVLGIARERTLRRVAGLALLALATTKVFVYDLASLDATYRVPSFIGLGVLLLTSSYVYQRFRPRPAARGDTALR